jgi:DNA-directed RNA polymerase specialized sigma24 family protein
LAENIDLEIRKGEILALLDFLRAVAPVVRRICRGVMGREDPEIEDATQECLIDVARAAALPPSRATSPTTSPRSRCAEQSPLANGQVATGVERRRRKT